MSKQINTFSNGQFRLNLLKNVSDATASQISGGTSIAPTADEFVRTDDEETAGGTSTTGYFLVAKSGGT